MMKQLLFSFLLFLIFFLNCTTTSAQAPAESPAAPATGPVSIISILKKAGHFTTLIRVLRNTELAEQVNSQVKKSSTGRTFFAPTDSAFSNLKIGTLNTLNDNKQIQLVQFHILPSFFTLPELQTVTNPVHTEAGDTNKGHFQLNITSSESQVNITTGLVSATVEKTLFSDNRLAVYQVDQVLLPLDLFGTTSVAQAPSKPEKSDGPADTDTDVTPKSSGAMAPNRQGMTAIWFGVAVSAVFSFCL